MKQQPHLEPDGAGGHVGPDETAFGPDETAVEDDVRLEDEAAEAFEWLRRCQEAAAQDEPTHEVGVGPIGDRALVEVVDRLTTSVDGLVALDPTGRDGKDLLEVLAQVQQQAQRLAGAVGHVTAAYEASREWRLKAKTASARLAHRCRAPIEEMRAQVRLGRNLSRMPLVDAALAEGTIATCHARKLGPLATGSRTAEAFARDEEMLVDFAKTLEWPGFCQAIKYWLLWVDPDGVEDNAAVDEAKRQVHLSDGIDGTGILNGILTPLGHATVREAMNRIYDELFNEDWTEARERLGREPTVDDLARTPSQRCHDALVRMAERSQAAGPNDKRSLPLLSILVDVETLTDQVCEVENTGTVVTPGTIARLLADYDDVLIERAVFDGPNRLVALSERRLFTGALRRAIQLRDQHCRWPGCHERAMRCQVDHVIPDCEGGPTSLDNGQCLCRGHNLVKERIRVLMKRRRRRQQ